MVVWSTQIPSESHLDSHCVVFSSYHAYPRPTRMRFFMRCAAFHHVASMHLRGRIVTERTQRIKNASVWGGLYPT